MSSQFFPEPARWRGDLSTRVPDAIRDGDLVARINAEHDACIGAAGRAVEHAIEAGRLLGEAKARVPHGGWMAWVEANCRFGRSTANNYMRVASNYQRAGNLEDEPESLRQALAMLAGPVKKKAALPSSQTPPGTSDEARRNRSFAQDVRRVIKECGETGEDVHDRMGFAQVEGAEGLAARFVVANVRQLTGPESEPEPEPASVPAPIRPRTGRIPESIAAIPEPAYRPEDEDEDEPDEDRPIGLRPPNADPLPASFTVTEARERAVLYRSEIDRFVADHGVGAIMGGDGAEDWVEVLGSWARTLQDHLGITTRPSPSQTAPLRGRGSPA